MKSQKEVFLSSLPVATLLLVEAEKRLMNKTHLTQSQTVRTTGGLCF